jgi:sirohydrochlorin cobaltochelatase
MHLPQHQSQHQQGIILFAHGSRDPLWRLPIEAVAHQIQSLSPDVPVMCAFLELTSPDLSTCVKEMTHRGLKKIAVVPMFLGIGKHAREDLPLLMSEIQAAYPQLQFELRKAIGEEPALTQAMAQIALQSPQFATHSKS